MVMKHATEYVHPFRYKLKVMNIPVGDCAYIYDYDNNQMVFANTTTPHFQLQKKSNNVAYYYY